MNQLKKIGNQVNVAKQKAIEKFNDVETSESPQIIEATRRLEDNKNVVKEIEKRVSKMTKTGSTAAEDFKGLSTALTAYEEYLSQASDNGQPIVQLSKKMAAVQSFVAGIHEKLNNIMIEKYAAPVTRLVEEDIKSAFKLKSRYDNVRVRYDAALQKSGNKPDQERDRAALKKELDTIGDETLETMVKTYDRCELINFESEIYYFDALADFFDKGSVFFSAVKADFVGFKTSLDSRRQEILTGKKATKTNANSTTQVFGVNLGELLLREKRNCPLIVEKAVQYLDTERGMKTEGLFRISGSLNAVERVRGQIDEGKIDFRDEDLHTVTGVLKLWLRKLPEPLLTFQRYREFLAVPRMANPEAQYAELKRLIDSLPEAHQIIARHLFLLWKKLADHNESNLMTPKALALVVGPNILYTKESDPIQVIEDMEPQNIVIATIISKAEDLFTEENIVRAVTRGDLANVQRLIKGGAEWKEVLDNTQTPLFFVAVKNNRLELVKYFIEELGVPVDTKDSAGLTAFHHAIIAKYEDQVMYLIGKGASIASDPLREKVDVERRAQMISPDFFKKIKDAAAATAESMQKKAEEDTKKQKEADAVTEKQKLESFAKEREEQMKRELEIQNKREMRKTKQITASAVTPTTTTPTTTASPTTSTSKDLTDSGKVKKPVSDGLKDEIEDIIQKPSPSTNPASNSRPAQKQAAKATTTPTTSTTGQSRTQAVFPSSLLVLNFDEFTTGVWNVIEVASQPDASQAQLSRLNEGLKDIVSELKILFTEVEARNSEWTDSEFKLISANATAIQDKMKKLIPDVKSANNNPWSGARNNLLRSSADLCDASSSFFVSVENAFTALIAFFVQDSANRLTQLLQIALGKAPAANFPQVLDSSRTAFSSLIHACSVKAFIIPKQDDATAIRNAIKTIEESSKNLIEVVSALVTNPADAEKKSQLSPLAKSLAGAFNSLTALTNTTLQKKEDNDDEFWRQAVNNLQAAKRDFAPKNPLIDDAFNKITNNVKALVADKSPASFAKGIEISQSIVALVKAVHMTQPLSTIHEVTEALLHLSLYIRLASASRYVASGSSTTQMNTNMGPAIFAVSHCFLYLFPKLK